MSLRGAVRVITTTARRVERSQQRRARLAARQYKEFQKHQAIVDAAQAVAEYNEYVSVLKTVHCDCSDVVDWAAMQQEAPPVMPVRTDEQERSAQAKFDTYQPSFLDKLFRSGPKKSQRLQEAIGQAKQQDDQLFRDKQAEYNRQHEEWQDRQELARQVLAKNSDVYGQVIEAFAPFEDIAELGSRLEFTFTSDHIEVDLLVNATDVVPDFTVSQLASGKLSRKPLSASKFNELYQDYVCSCLLRIGREVQAHLPVSQVVVHALARNLNTATGLVEKQVILSVAMPRFTLDGINMMAIDPSDSMRNFNHTMKFTKTGGFSPVERVGLAAPIPFPKRR
ncbi:hypothetical protein ACAW74_27570 [Fibrella sp. WM1]|uniref:Uncharacterized protein n=1 Tax=Spirosoma sordidisoli TaxID=2502893 RepID=A0A4Q2UCZ7_9BACT|nr:hypothetical protein [Spirosoma sordidisoli]RYC66764.1 hypothetical protein EQG79_28440 [Spirosoma sordidisoli]